MKGLKIKFKVAEGPPRPQDVSTDTLAIAVKPFAGPTMFGAKASESVPRATLPKATLSKSTKPVSVPVPKAQVPVSEAPEAPEASVPEAPVPEAPVPEATEAPEESTGLLASDIDALPEEVKVEPPKKRVVVVKRNPNPLPPELVALQSSVKATEQENPYDEQIAQPFVPADRKAFTKFIETRYSSFVLPRPLTSKINPDACSQMTLQTYKYQAFIREYMREASPSRGILVYHGLGSGKTCTSIGAAEALYGQGKKIIVMTPVALKENFLNELMFCGFRHFQLKNKWVPFTLTPIISLFAQQQVGLPATYTKRLEKSGGVLWMPDLSVPESESNFSTLSPQEQTAIRKQIYEMLQNKFTFIGYTGVTKKFLMDIVTSKPTFFDDAVVIVDEIHNLTRLMANKLDKYLVPPKKSMTAFQAKDSSYEIITPETWKPKFANEPERYSRAYLLYRLLSQAKNSKIIALSGTPIVNAPLEISILTNILHGYFHAVSDTLAGDDSTIQQAKDLIDKHPHVNFHSFKKNDSGGIQMFFTKMDEGYSKQFDDDMKLEGIIYDEDATQTIQEIYDQVKTVFAENKLILQGQPVFSALPLLPPTTEEFNDTFVDASSLSLKNPITFKKRVSGLVSYYKGSKAELMPATLADTIVECPFSPHAFKGYAVSRLKELAESKPSKPSLQEAEALGESESTSYRFRSRASCNFAFPPGIDRPYPGTKEEVDSEAGISKNIYGDGVEVENLEEDAEEQEEDKEAPALSQPKKVEDYQTRLATALQKLRQAGTTIFKIDGPPGENLANYSSKYSAIIKNTMASKGSSLVYSQFKTVEGIGILAMALEVNGFTPIVLEGSEDNLQFSAQTIESLTTRPEQPRFIVYSGGESIRVRQTLINIFNMFIDKLPSEIKKVLQSLPIAETRNLKGQVCKVFMITGAGAEGLSLRNVRTVHIMEPYWNKVRTEQVKGRAIRICSHADLPFEERNVEIFNYISTITPELLKTQQTLEIQDDGKSTDQHILALAEIKEKVNSSFLTAMKSAAVDCSLNAADNERIKCFVQQGSDTDFLYDPRLREDIASTDQSEVESEVERKGYKLKGVHYVGLVQDGKTILYAATNSEFTTPLGEVNGNKVKWYR